VTAGVLVPSRNWTPRLPRRWTTKLGVSEGFNQNEWVKINVDRIASPASTIPWRVSRFSSPDAKKRFVWEMKSIPAEERSAFIHSYHAMNEKAMVTKSHYLEPEPDHPLEKLLENPNPFLDRQTMIERMTQHLLLGGNTIVTKVRAPKRGRGVSGQGPPLELWVMPPDNFNPVPDRRKFIKHYEMEVPDQQKPMEIPVQDVIHMLLPDPDDLYWGGSVLKSAARIIDMDVASVEWQRQSMENRAAPDGVFAIQDEIDETEFEVMREQMRVQYYGRGNARTPMLMGNNAKYYQLSLTPVEMDFIESRKMTREGICAVFGVDPRVAGIIQGNPDMKEIDRRHYTTLILPWMDRLQSNFNRSLVPEFGGDLLVWYDTMNVDALQDIFHDKAKSVTLIARNGVPLKAINRRLRLGFYDDELEGLDVGFLPASSRSVPNVLAAENEPNVTGNTGDQNSNPDGGESDNPDENNEGNGTDTSQTDEETEKRVERIREMLRKEIERERDDDDSSKPGDDGQRLPS
jgi:HK97 family phage portal protein